MAQPNSSLFKVHLWNKRLVCTRRKHNNNITNTIINQHQLTKQNKETETA